MKAPAAPHLHQHLLLSLLCILPILIDLFLPTKVHLVKTMVFPVVVYGCESWTIKKAECKELMLLNCGVGEEAQESLDLQGDQSSQS